MNRTYLPQVAQQLPEFWRSKILSEIAGAKIKVIKMGGEGIPDEVHEAFDEFLLVIDGELTLILEEEHILLRAGEYFVIPKNKIHRVAANSWGTLLLIDA